VGRPDLTAAGLGLAYSLSYAVGLSLSFRRLRGRLPGLDGRRLGRHAVRVLVATLPSAAAAYGIGRLVPRWSDGRPALLLGLVLAGVAAVGLFVLTARLLHIAEVDQILDPLLRRVRRGGSAGDPDRKNNRGGGSDPDGGTPTPTIGPAVDQVVLSPQPGAEGVVADDPTHLLAATQEESPGMTDLDVRDVTDHGDPDQRETDQRETDHDGDQGAISTVIRPATAPRLPAGTVLVGRYRLEEILAFSEPTVTWRAFDLTLSRSVLVHLLPSSDERAPRLLAAARRAAGATDSRFLRVLDAVEGARVPGHPEASSSYIVCEYATGQALDTVLGTAPLTGLEAAWLIREVADAMAGVHAAGLHHGRLSPDTVIVTPSGNVKIVGLLIEQAMRPESSHAPLPSGGRVDLEPAEADLLDLGRLLYAALVGRWPGGPAYGLPDAPTDGQHWMTPRQIRAGVSPALDRITDQVLGRPPRHHLTPIASVPELVAALSRTLGPADASADLERRLRQPFPQVSGTDPRRTWATLEQRAGSGSSAPASRQTLDQPTEQMATVFRSAPATPSAPSATAPTTASSTASTSSATPPSTTAPARTAPGAWPPAATGGAVRHVAPASPSTPTRRPAVTLPAPGVVGPGGGSPPPAPRRQPRRWIAVLVALLVLVVGTTLVLAFGPGERDATPPTFTRQTPAPSTGATAGTTYRIVTARDFDPQGTDARPPRENPGEVPNAYDGNPATGWRTVTYQGNPQLGGIKRGVGIILDLGRPEPVSDVALRLSGTGTTLQIRVPKGDAATVSAPNLTTDGGWRTVGSAAKVGSTATVTLKEPVTTRFVLVYLTSLPKEGSGYRGGINEVEVRA
jgi:putative peptidoglycan lipid II flippase